jgi:hypothetical protein
MKFSFSSLAIGLVAFACLLVDFSLKNWEKEDRVIEWDVHSYYGYLPEYFIYHDVKFEKSDYLFDYGNYLFWPVFTEDGKKVEKMTMGTAVLYSPFFFVAHVFASLTDYPEDGFSVPYKIFLLLSSVFYLIIGLDFLKKILNRYNFPDKIIAAVILLIGLGTNLLCYSSEQAPMSHVYSFCLFAIFIYYTIKWYEQQSIKNTVIIGLLSGLISLIRPTNAAIILFFILYGISNFTEFKERINLFFKKYFHIILMAFCTFLAWVPQFLYWKTVTGHYICYSYTDEGFFFSHPRIMEGLFSWRKGWLVYTPMMAFALLGLFFLKGELKKFRFAIIIFMAVNVYIIFSWWCWWYGGTFGQRSFIESYCLLAVPFASFIQFLSTQKIFYKILLGCIVLFLIWLNIFQTYQFEFHSLHYDGMTKELYFKQFGKLKAIPGYDSMARCPNYEEAKKGNSWDIPYYGKAQNTPPLPAINSKKETGRKTIQLKAANGKYVCADQALNNIVVANRDIPQGWETFTLILFENNECAILASDNKFLCSELDRDNEITATRDHVSKWETFSLIEIDSTHVAFKASNGKFLSVDETSLKLYAKSESIGSLEKFEMVIK